MPAAPQLSIPRPCAESWEQMTPGAGGRHCANCRKTVVDFTAMTDAEVLRWLSEQRGTTCGRFHPDQLGRPLVKPRRSWPGLRYFFTFTLPALLLSLKAGAASRPGVIPVEVSPARPLPADTLPSPSPRILRGTVRNEQGEPIPFAIAVEAGTKNQVVADSAGNFEIKLQLRPEVAVWAQGYETVKVDCPKRYQERNIQLPQAGYLGEVVIIDLPARKKTRRELRKEKKAARKAGL
ncbi:hypothetical protein EPD60_03630 [Flaviaesturariibacter flavus]|uniref:Carboxypeptidase-like regulatory domain-containing protein n=1 Tax=Flaviaesturariibacter flavus TaxID=2502780 RepID=A0A4R1BMD3_9BACT|nr:carboxypeptidase-like regulatory domain-containing protein [Flaviaesturariibacter flavus]TCJ18603.1 hypothetical protein EPD60_03630 [Flaviaesturariibacter flavus]